MVYFVYILIATCITVNKTVTKYILHPSVISNNLIDQKYYEIVIYSKYLSISKTKFIYDAHRNRVMIMSNLQQLKSTYIHSNAKFSYHNNYYINSSLTKTFAYNQ